MDNQMVDNLRVGIRQQVDSLMRGIHKELGKEGTPAEAEDKPLELGDILAVDRPQEGDIQSTVPEDNHQNHDHYPFRVPSSREIPCHWCLTHHVCPFHPFSFTEISCYIGKQGTITPDYYSKN